MMTLLEEALVAVKVAADTWHAEDRKIFDLPEATANTVQTAAIKLLYHNYQTWHLIDLYKLKSNAVPHDDHGILHNKLRNYAISELDSHFEKIQSPYGVMHSETLGDIVDKISILYLKMLHLPETDPNYKYVKEHYDILMDCAEDLYNQMYEGTRRCPNIKRFKV